MVRAAVSGRRFKGLTVRFRCAEGARRMEEASVAGESPDRSKQHESSASSAETTPASPATVPGPARSGAQATAQSSAPADPRMAMARERAATVRVDQATAVFSTKALSGEGSRTADAAPAAEPETATDSAGSDGASGEKNAEGDTRLRAAVAAWVAGSDEPAPEDASDGDAGDQDGAGTGAGATDGSGDADDDAEASEGDTDGAQASGEAEGADAVTGPADEQDEPAEAEATDGTSDADDADASGATSATDEAADSAADIDIDADTDGDEDAGSGSEPRAAADATPADDEPEDDEPEDARASASEDTSEDASGPEAEARHEDEPQDAPQDRSDAAGDSSDEPVDAPADAVPDKVSDEPSGAKPDFTDTDSDEDSAPEPRVDQPTAVFKTQRRPAVDQPTTMLKLGGATRRPADETSDEKPGDKPAGTSSERTGDKPASSGVRTSKFVPLNRLDDFAPARPKPESAAEPETAEPETAKPEPAKARPARPEPAKAASPAAPAPAAKPARTAPPAPKPVDRPATATATTAIPQVGPERTTQLPLPPKPPLDLLAELTNTPPPPQTPVRTLVRRVKIWTPLVLLLVVIFAVAQAFRPLPAPSLVLSADSTYTFGGGTLDLPWPGQGQSAIEVDGVGSLGTDGKQTPAPTASVAKIMTAYVILQEHPLKGNEDGEKITVDQQAEDESKLPDESTARMTKGQQFTERQMLQMLMIPSGNNVARLLSRWDSDAKSFVAKMNAAAKDLGMTNTTYTDPSGLQKTTVSTATDQIKLAKKVMKNDVFRSIVGMAKADIPGLPGTIYNNNDLLVKQVGVIGLKTGSSTPAGGNLVWAATKVVDGKTQTIYGAVMNQNAGTGKLWDSLQLAITNSQKLIDKVQQGLVTATVVKKGQVVGYVDDQLGGRTPVVATKNMTAIGWPGLKTRLSMAEGTSAVPHTGKAGTVVGELRVGDGSSDAVRIPVALKSDLAEPGFGAKLTRVG